MTILNENWKNLIKPEVKFNKDGFNSTAVVEPLETGYGLTLGNSLRRVMLSSIYGFAVTSVKIDGVYSEYSSIEGIREDVVDIIMNIKSIIIEKTASTSTTLNLKVKGKGEFKAGDIETSEGVSILNKDSLVCTSELASVDFNISINVEYGCGYKIITDEEKQKKDLGLIYIDAVFTPVKKINFKVKSLRIGDKVDYDKLIFDISTDGTITPKEVLSISAKILQTQLSSIIDFKEEVEENESSLNKVDELLSNFDENLLTPVEKLKLSSRTFNCLEANDMKYIGDFIHITEAKFIKMQNFGKKSLNELIENLAKFNLSLGTVVPGWEKIKNAKLKK